MLVKNHIPLFVQSRNFEVVNLWLFFFSFTPHAVQQQVLLWKLPRLYLISLLLIPFTAATLFQTTSISTTTVVSYLLCFFSCLLESTFDPEIKVTFEKGKSDDFSLAYNPSTFHHIPRIKSKVVNSIHIDLHTLPDFSSCPQPYQYLYLCCGHSEVLLFEQAKFILSSGPLHVSFPLPGNHLSTFWIPPLSPGLCSGVPLIRDELFIHTLKIPPIPRTHI